MINWNYDSSQYSESNFQLIPEGDHRCRIEEVTEKTFKSKKNGLEITLTISGYNSRVWFYLVFNPDNPEQTNQNIGSIFNSFGIADHNLNHYPTWVGKVGACRIKHEEWQGEKSAKVKFFISQANAQKKNLPAWKEPTVGGTAPAANDGFTTIPATDDDIPF